MLDRSGPEESEAEKRGVYFNELDIIQTFAANPGPIRDSDVPDADVIIATWWETAFSVASLSPSKGKKFHFIQGHEVHRHLPKNISRVRYYPPLKKITVPQWLADVMAEEYGGYEVNLVENSVDTGILYAPLRDKNSALTVAVPSRTIT